MNCYPFCVKSQLCLYKDTVLGLGALVPRLIFQKFQHTRTIIIKENTRAGRFIILHFYQNHSLSCHFITADL